MWEQLFEMIFKPDFLFSVIRITSPILFAALAAVVAEKAGVTNIGLEGIMSITALFGTLISYWTQSWAIGVLGALIIAFRRPLAALYAQPPEVDALIVGLLTVVAATYLIRYFPFIQIMGIFRAGGDPKTGAILDFVGVWVISIPLALVGGLWLRLPFLAVYGTTVLLDALVKVIPGTIYFLSRKWIRPVTG